MSQRDSWTALIVGRAGVGAASILALRAGARVATRGLGAWAAVLALLAAFGFSAPAGAQTRDTNGELRLVDGSSALEGRVEVYKDGQWGTVCDDNWGNVDASTACRQLGYHSGTATVRAHFGRGSGPIWMDEVQCTGDEDRLIDCTYDSTPNCLHNEDAGAVCMAHGAPAFTTAATQSVAENTTAVVTLAASDPNDDPVTYAITGGADSELFALSGAELAFRTAPDYESPADADADNVYEVTVEASDDHGKASALALRVSVTDDLGDAPTAIKSVAITSTPSIDADGGNAPDTYGRREYVEVTVTWTADVTWDLRAAGADMRMRLDVGGHTRVARLVTGGSASGTARALAFRYTVTRIDGDSDGLFPKPASNGVLVHLLRGATLKDALDRDVLRAHAGLSADADHKVDGSRMPAVANRAPGFPAGAPATLEVVENNAAGAAAGTVAAEDPDGDAMTYALDSASDAVFDIDSNGAITVTEANALDRETKASYSVTVSVHDGKNGAGQPDTAVDATHKITISVTAAPYEPATGELRLVGGSSALEGRVEVYKDGQWGTVCNDYWGAVDASTACRQLGYHSGTTAYFGRGRDPIWMDDVQCTGDEDRLIDCTHNSYHNCAHNEDAGAVCMAHGAPAFTTEAAQSVAENTRAVVELEASDPNDDPVTYAITGGADSEQFSLTGRWLVFRATPDYEAPADADGDNVYEVTVEAADGHGGEDSLALRVSVTDVENDTPPPANRAPALTTEAAQSVAENTTAVVTLAASDPDADPVVYSITGGADSARFALSEADLVFRTAPDHEAPADTDADNVYEVTVEVSDERGGTGSLALQVRVTNVEELATGDLQLMDGSSALEGRVEVYKDGRWGTVCDDNWGNVDASTACRQLGYHSGTAKGGAYFGHGSNPSRVYGMPIWMDEVQCTGSEDRLIGCTHNSYHDCAHLEDAGAVCMAHGAPAFTTAAAQSVAENTRAVVELEASDPNDDPVTYAIKGGADSELFALSGAELAFRTAPVYESPADADADNVYEVTVEASDEFGETSALALRVSVTDTADDTPPAIESVAITSTPSIDADGDNAPDTYGRRENVEVTVTWTADVTWDLRAASADMRMRLDVGGHTQVARLVTGGSASGTARALAFRYTVTRTDGDSDGLFPKPASNGVLVQLLRGATLTDALDRDASRAHAGLSADADHKVDGSRMPPAVTETISVSDASGAEGATLSFAVSLSAAADSAATVDYVTADGTATAGEDYTAASGTLTFAPGETSKTVAVATVSDQTAEGDETFTLTLSDPWGATLADGQATGTVTGVAAVAGVRVSSTPREGDTYGLEQEIRVEVTLSEPVEVDASGGTPTLTIDMDPAHWGAKQADYEGGSGTAALTFVHTVVRPNLSTQGIAVTANSLALNGGTITRVADGSAARLGHAGLAHDPAHKVDWRQGSRVGVEDARAVEGSDAALDFTVWMERPATERVTVTYTTADGTATAGEDYAATSGTLVFDTGEREKTIAVTVLDDAHDEGEETMTLRLTNVTGGRIVYERYREATGTIVNSDPLLNAWLARYGRSVASQTLDAVSQRLARSAGSGGQVTLGGQGLSLAGQAGNHGDAETGRDVAAATWTGGPVTDENAGWFSPTWTRTELGSTRSLTGKELLLGSSFHLTAEGRGGAHFAGWGRFGMESFRNTDDGLPVEGEVVTGVFGADFERGDWLAGVALTHSFGEGEMRPRGSERQFDYGLESTVTALNPYVRLKLSERLSAWGLAGYGEGKLELTHTPKPGEPETSSPTGKTYATDLGMTLGAAGARGELLAPAAPDGLSVALKGDAFWVRTTSEAVSVEGLGNLAAAEADASRLRITLEGSRAFTLAHGATLTPTLETGVRHDGGDAETGTGLEIGGALRYESPSSRVSMDLRARSLIAHARTGYREWGLSGSLRIAPGAEGRGFALTLAPTWGADVGPAQRLWSVRDAAALARVRETDPSARLDAEVGYGFAAPVLAGTVRPYAGVALSARDAGTYRLGTHWQLAPAVTLSLEGERYEADADSEANTGIMLRAALRW